MPASYPTSTKTFSTKATNDVIEASHVNDIQDEITAIENGLRTGLAHAVLPDATVNNRDLGSSGSKFRDLWLSGDANIADVLAVTGNGPHGIGNAPVADQFLRLAGTISPVSTGFGVVIGPTISAAVNQEAYGTFIQPTFNEAASGTHGALIGLYVAAPIVNVGAAAVTSAASLFVANAPAAAGAANFALLVQSGTANFLGPLWGGGQFALANDISPAQITANQNNYNPTGLSTAYMLRLSSDASRNITGLVAQADGTKLLLANLGAQNIVLTHNDTANSTAANCFHCPGGANFTLAGTNFVELYYSGTDQRWFVVN